MKVIVYHSYYGCDTGCCGHVVETEQETKEKGYGEFYFDHPYNVPYNDKAAHLKFAKELVEQRFGQDHALDLDWENCIVIDD